MKAHCHLELNCQNTVGESLVWNANLNALHWVDILQKKIYSLSLADSSLKVDIAPDFVTSIGLTKDRQAIVGLLKKIYIWDFGGGWHELARIEPDESNTRLNEGVVGPDGHFWVGTMQNNFSETGLPIPITANQGQLYQVNQQGDIKSASDDLFGITNTFVWPNKNTLITADTLKNLIYSYEINPEGLLENRKTLVQEFPRGLPDGSCMDAEGFIWNCRVVGGSCLIRFAPSGVVDRIMELPCTWPTSCTFGGPNLDRLYVTSARFTMTDQHLKENPQEGGLFSMDVGVQGLAPYLFGS
jgi:sugar lactone lactonase YvrE